jgi:predicted nucleic acid-binding protein
MLSSKTGAVISVYVDSSFVVSLYLTDVHSPEARRLSKDAPPLPLTPLHLAEWAHALGHHQVSGTITAQAAQEVHGQFVADEAHHLWRATPLPETAFELCTDLARRFASKLGMRTLDTLHVACALELKAERFWTFDQQQSRLAKTTGMNILQA